MKEFLKRSIEQSNLKMILYRDVQESMTVEKLENMLETRSKGRKYVAGELFDDR